MLTEQAIQKLLATKFNAQGSLCVPNCGVFGWEADLVRISKHLIASEYEIKISTADFRADSKKWWKHGSLSNTGESSRRAKGMTPAYFWYVAPVGVIPHAEVPKYAGLIELVGTDIVRSVKAPKLHKHEASLRQVLYVSRGAAIRFWNLQTVGGK